MLAKARLGEDVVEKKEKAKATQRLRIGELVKRYLDERQANFRPASYIEQVRYLERYWAPLHKSGIDMVSRREVVVHLDEIAEAHGKGSADRGKDALSAFFSWAIDKGLLENNPAIGIRRRNTNGARSRVLHETELLDIWQACGGDDYGRIIRLLILTAQRRTEISDLAWSEIDIERSQISLPPERVKNKRHHIIPLSAVALSIINQIPKRFGRDFLFGDGSRGFVGWSSAKSRFDSRLPAMSHWTIHDIRRSVITHLNERGFAQPHIAEAIANHVSGHKAGVAGIYNRSVYGAEKKAALEAWGQHISALLARDG